MTGIKSNGILLAVRRLPDHKRPVLTVSIENECVNEMYVVASFSSEEKAKWTEEMLEAMFAQYPEVGDTSNED